MPSLTYAIIFFKNFDFIEISIYYDPEFHHFVCDQLRYDKKTGTLWYHYRKGLMGIKVEYLKRWLPKIPSKDNKWKDWEKDNLILAYCIRIILLLNLTDYLQ